MIGLFIWTVMFLFIGIFIGYAIGSYSEIQRDKKNQESQNRNCR